MRWLALLLLLGAVQAQETIAELQARGYGKGELAIERTLGQNRGFTRYLVRWPSEGLTQYGFMNVPSGKGPYPVVLVLQGVFRVSYAIDVLNLAAIVRKQSGKGPLAKADGSRVGLWGHSMSGGIAIRVAVVDPQIRAVVLYGSMSSDERKNASQIYYVYSGRTRGLAELNAPDEHIRAISSGSSQRR